MSAHPEGRPRNSALFKHGRAVVGGGGVFQWTSGDFRTAMLWTASSGMVDLNLYLRSLGLDLEGWVLTEAVAVSADGRRILGTGLHDGVEEPWLATLPFVCRADVDGDGTLDIWDVLEYVALWLAGDPHADHDDDPGLQVADIFAFLNAWFDGCP